MNPGKEISLYVHGDWSKSLFQMQQGVRAQVEERVEWPVANSGLGGFRPHVVGTLWGSRS